MPGSDDLWSAWIEELVRDRRFQRRNLSWVHLDEHYFLKIPRRSERPDRDLDDPAAVSEAEAEYRLTGQLAALDRMIDPPLFLVRACLVMRRLWGADLWRLALCEGASRRVLAGLEEGVALAARLHRRGAVTGVPRHDYARDPFLPAPAEFLPRLEERPRTLVVGGWKCATSWRTGPPVPGVSSIPTTRV